MSSPTRTRRRPRPFPPDIASPPSLLYRIGRWPDLCGLPSRPGWPSAWSASRSRRALPRPVHRRGRRACFVETLATFRPPLDADLDPLRLYCGGRRPPLLGRIPPDWHRRRAVCPLHPAGASGRGFLDLRALPTPVILRDVFAALLVDLGLGDLDVSGVCGPSRKLPQAIGAWAYVEGHDGIAYRSRFEDAYTCWALFESRATWAPTGPPS